jgi:hypothetical protein
MSEVSYRWIDGPDATEEEWDRIDQVLASRGWMSLSRTFTRIRIAEREGRIIGFYVLQHIPHVEPMWVDKREWGAGVAEHLADDMQNFLTEVNARGFMAVCESPIAKKMCEARGMVQVHFPVYVSVSEAK